MVAQLIVVYFLNVDVLIVAADVFPQQTLYVCRLQYACRSLQHFDGHARSVPDERYHRGYHQPVGDAILVGVRAPIVVILHQQTRINEGLEYEFQVRARLTREFFQYFSGSSHLMPLGIEEGEDGEQTLLLW